MRLEKRNPSRTPDSAKILVSGTDMFGVAFREKSCLLNRSKEGLAFKLLRPVKKGSWLEINFHPEYPETSSWLAVELIWVNQGLDGFQTLGVRVDDPSLRAPHFKKDGLQRPPFSKH